MTIFLLRALVNPAAALQTQPAKEALRKFCDRTLID